MQSTATASVGAQPDVVNEVPENDERTRVAEEKLMLLLGFGIGLTVGGVFLIYILLEFAGLFP